MSSSLRLATHRQELAAHASLRPARRFYSATFLFFPTPVD
jgi:hypothetical protein